MNKRTIVTYSNWPKVSETSELVVGFLEQDTCYMYRLIIFNSTYVSPFRSTFINKFDRSFYTAVLSVQMPVKKW